MDISEIEADQKATKLKQLEKILESREEKFRDADSTEESCQGKYPEELSDSKLQKLQEQLNIRRRKSVSRGRVEDFSTDF